MNGRRLVAALAWCFWPAAPRAMVGAVGYCAYLAWLAVWEIERLGTTSYLHLIAAAAVLGAWLGGCVARGRTWMGAALVPGYRVALGSSACVVAISGMCAIACIGWSGGLNAGALLSIGGLTLSVFLVCGYALPVLAFYLLLSTCCGVVLAPALGHDAWPDGVGSSLLAWLALAAICPWCLFVAMLRSPRSVPYRSEWTLRSSLRLVVPRHLWPPSAHRVGILAGSLAGSCAFGQRALGAEWKDFVSMLVIGSMCAHFGSVGASASFPRGPIPAASWLLLFGAKESRAGVGRRVLSKIILDSVFAAGVFSGVLFVLGADFHLLEMLLLALAACHLYLAGASSSRWLMSSRYSAVVAAPVVVALSGAAWFFGPWGLPTSIAACLVTGAVAIYIGGIGIGRLDLDAAFTAEASQ